MLFLLMLYFMTSMMCFVVFVPSCVFNICSGSPPYVTYGSAVKDKDKYVRSFPRKSKFLRHFHFQKCSLRYVLMSFDEHILLIIELWSFTGSFSSQRCWCNGERKQKDIGELIFYRLVSSGHGTVWAEPPSSTIILSRTFPQNVG